MSSPTSPRATVDLFDQYLRDFQDDLKRIISAHRYPSHRLTEDELLSEANLALIKKREDLVEGWGSNLTKDEFRRTAYAYTRNVIVWTHSRIMNTKYVARRIDLSHYTEEGQQSTYEIVCDTIGEEEAFYEDFDGASKCKYLLKMVQEYCHVLTSKETQVLAYLEKGLNQYDIADKLEVTHQAVWAIIERCRDKFQMCLPANVLNDSSPTKVTQGHKASSNFFLTQPLQLLTADDRVALQSFLVEHCGLYTATEVSAKFLNGKYNPAQIRTYAAKNKFGAYLKKKNRPSFKFSREQDSAMLELFREGRSSSEIAKIIGAPMASVRGKRGAFVKAGLLTSVRAKV